jgi:hypothetical protein
VLIELPGQVQALFLGFGQLRCSLGLARQAS